MMESNFPFLMSMKDKTIQVFKGGPESKTGKLLYVKSDYLALETKDGTVIYYQLSHLKSVIEDSKGNPLFIDHDEDDESSEDENGEFLELLNDFVLHDIQVNQGGPESRAGLLLLVRPDYLAISTEKDGVVYYNLEHIKSICEVIEEDESSEKGESSEKDESGESEESSSSCSSSSDEESTEWVEVIVEDLVPQCVFEEDFNALLGSFNQRWVTINSGGPEKVEGVLVECSFDHVTLVHHKDVFKIATFHIKTVQVASVEEEEESEDESSENQDESSNSDNENNDDDNDTGGRRDKGPNPFKHGYYRGRR